MEPQLVKEFTLSLSGVEVIYKFHTTLLEDLKVQLDSWSPTSQLGALFLPMVDFSLCLIFNLFQLITNRKVVFNRHFI